MTELPWIKEAKSLIGLKEINGVNHNPTIKSWLKSLKAAWTDDETPWCGTFVAHCLSSAGRSIPKHWYRAKEYLNYGTELTSPAYGCIAVKSRAGGGHVFFVVGETSDGAIVGLGGNQNNQVSLAKFSKSDIVGYVWPSWANGVPSMPSKERFVLPKYKNNLQENQSEA